MSTWFSLEPGLDEPVENYWDADVTHVYIDVATERSWSDRVRLIAGETGDAGPPAILTPAQVRVLIEMLKQAIAT